MWMAISSNTSSCSALSTSVRQQWKPKFANVEERRKLRGQQHESEKIGTKAFHHVEFYCGDAKSTAHRFSSALGMPITGTSGQHTGNDNCVSYGLESGQVRFLLTAPYSQAMSSTGLSSTQSPVASTKIDDAPNPLPNFSPADAHQFFAKHGMAVRALGLEVKDAKAAFDASVANGARPVSEPTFVPTCHGQLSKGQTASGCYMAEVALYGDVVLRYLSFPDAENISSDKSDKRPLPFLPHLAPLEGKMAERKTFGLRRIDHAVGNVPNLFETLNEVSAFTGFHDFAEFSSEEVGTVESGLNSVVLASDSDDILLPLNEPVNGK